MNNEAVCNTLLRNGGTHATRLTAGEARYLIGFHTLSMEKTAELIALFDAGDSVTVTNSYNGDCYALMLRDAP